MRGRRAAGSGRGIYGHSSTGVGVLGESAGSTGVFGDGALVGVIGHGGSGGLGVWGYSPGYVGVFGESKGQAGVSGRGKPGVYGVCYMDNGSGVRGDGNAPGTIGVFCKNTPSRRALRTQGKIQADCCRKKTLSNMSNLITLPTSVKAGSTAAVLATMQGNPGNDAVIQRAYRVDSTHIRIVFNKKPARGTMVAYWVVHPA